MKAETQNKPSEPLVEILVMPRIEGTTARRIRRLAEKTSISESRIANMAAEEGITAVEKRFK